MATRLHVAHGLTGEAAENTVLVGQRKKLSFKQNRLWLIAIARWTGGLASERFPIPPGDEITKVEIGVESYMLNGLRFHMSGGTSGGHLDENTPVHTLEPSPGHKIVGFYGWSRWGQIFNEVMEFGIITAPGDINDLPEIIYDMPELRNSNGGNADVS
ncbi:hypothetical protein ONS95_005839 [Cadophora gregata]|uniref:uncharacterized protein n=1 Tax=Cadophora gregata TaxID=51156 RepID=UPI0026DC862E|nr:uncharacterized protein ONS95_005839 [Cadophora gregata]KAK0102214.1 hypothetical protein ONS95_005839 [Cadophora gregata]